MNTPRSIGDLLNLAVERHGTDSGRELERIAQAGGFRIVHTTINAIRAGSYKSSPSERTLKAIAFLANVPDRVAFEAVGRQPHERPFVDDLPPGVDDLLPSERRVAVEMLRLMVTQRQELNEFLREKGSQVGRAITSVSPERRTKFVEAMEARKGEGKDEDLSDENPGLSLVDDKSDEPEGYELAARKGETRERKRRRLEGEPWDHPDPDGPEDGA